MKGTVKARGFLILPLLLLLWSGIVTLFPEVASAALPEEQKFEVRLEIQDLKDGKVAIGDSLKILYRGRPERYVSLVEAIPGHYLQVLLKNAQVAESSLKPFEYLVSGPLGEREIYLVSATQELGRESLALLFSDPEKVRSLPGVFLESRKVTVIPPPPRPEPSHFRYYDPFYPYFYYPYPFIIHHHHHHHR